MASKRGGKSPPNLLHPPAGSTVAQQPIISSSSSAAVPSGSPMASTSMVNSPGGAASTPSSSSTTTAGSSSSTSARTGTRNRRQELSFAERIQVISTRDSGKSMRQLASEFGCGKTQILNIIGQKESYLREWNEKKAESNPHISSRKRRSRRTGNEETNRLVWEWYTSQRDQGVRVTGPMLQREARSIARGLGILNFAASNGWLDSFRRLHNIGPQSRAAAAAAGLAQQQADRRASGLAGGCPPIAVTSSTPEPTFHPPTAYEHFHQEAPPPLPPPPPLEPNVYPQHEYFAEEAGNEDSRRMLRGGDGIAFTPEYAQPDPGDSEFKHFASMAAVFQGNNHPAANQGQEERMHQYGQGGDMEAMSAMDADHHRFIDQFSHSARIHSSSSNYSSNFSPTEGFRGGDNSRHDNSFSMDQSPSESSYQQSPYQQSGDQQRVVIQDARFLAEPSSEDRSMVQPQRRSVLVSTRSAVAAAAAAAASSGAAAYEHHPGPSEQPVDDRRRLVMAASSGSSSGAADASPGYFGELGVIVRSHGLFSCEYSDERGDAWLEIRPPPATSFRVPFFGYRTHLMRLIVNSHLAFWLEVLGHCVRTGTFRSLTSGGVDAGLVQPLIDLFNGGATVCQGRGSVLKRVHQFHPRAALEQGLANRNYFTLPDYRYRSYDCLRLVDSRTGATQCSACQRAPDPPLPPVPPLEGIHASSALRLQEQGQLEQEQQRQRPPPPPPPLPPAPQQPRSEYSTTEPLNLSTHPPGGVLIRLPAASPKDTPVFTAIYSAGQRLLAADIPLVVQQQEGAQPSGSGELDDFRLANEAAFLSLNRERVRSGEVERLVTSPAVPQRRTRSDSPQAANSPSYDPEFHTTWIKQETLDSSHSNGS